MEPYTKLTINKNNLLLVFVDKKDVDFEIVDKHLFANPSTYNQRFLCKLPPGNWKILALSNQMEDQHLQPILPGTFVHRRFSHFQDILEVVTDGEIALVLKKIEE